MLVFFPDVRRETAFDFTCASMPVTIITRMNESFLGWTGRSLYSEWWSLWNVFERGSGFAACSQTYTNAHKVGRVWGVEGVFDWLSRGLALLWAIMTALLREIPALRTEGTG